MRLQKFVSGLLFWIWELLPACGAGLLIWWKVGRQLGLVVGGVVSLAMIIRRTAPETKAPDLRKKAVSDAAQNKQPDHLPSTIERAA